MKLSDFDYHLPKNLIAQKPIRPRDHSRLLVCIRRRATNAAHPNSIRTRRPAKCGAHPNGNRNRGNFKIEHKYFYDIIDYLHKSDVLVLNNSKVFPARLIGKKIPTGGRIEVFLLKKNNPLPAQAGPYPPYHGGKKSPRPPLLKGASEVWQCLVGGKNRREGQKIKFSQSLKAEIIKDNQDGAWQVKFNQTGAKFKKLIQAIGQVPLPPYIKRKAGQPFKLDSKDYQTVYADPKKLGSVAAPTAGFHFTPALFKKIKNKGVQIEFITLHVGLGTFAPIKFDDISKHKMQEEWVEVPGDTLKRIVKAKQEGRRIIAVGTTSVRTLEKVLRNKRGLAPLKGAKPLQDFHGWVNIFIHPGFKFKVVDAIITNFHLPKSTLLMLVSAFAGKHNIDKAYESAIKNKYRFYSYGDAMLII